MALTEMKPKFELGQTVATPGALRAFEVTGQDISWFMSRHHAGDWGVTLDAEDQAANDRALIDGDRLLSAYELADKTRIWIITEWDRSATTVLLPEEY